MTATNVYDAGIAENARKLMPSLEILLEMARRPSLIEGADLDDDPADLF